MKKKIVITGGLGYIGTELCNIYSGEAWFNEIIVIDKNFYSARVNELKNWNIKFFHGDILDKKFLKKILDETDVVHHLAGITDVAYIKNDKNFKRDLLISKTAIDGTNNILELIPKKCKIIFPSSHVVFDGLRKKKLNLKENDKVKPALVYSKSKYQNENDIKKSGKDYIIFRLGSAYGYSGDATRVNIMPNLFSKKTALNEEIKLFAGGKQLKSLVAVKDVARCFKYFEEKKYKNKIINLVNESLTVKSIALICKSHNKKANITNTSDKIPNLGYTLSNKKLKKFKFKFNYNIRESIKEMISKWSYEKPLVQNEIINDAENPYIDKRGKILNYQLPEPINLIGLIDSKAKTIRANHFHPIQEQKCLVTKGKFISVLKNIKEKNSIIETQIINENQITVTKPNVAHAMIFLEDTQFLNLVRGERDHKNFGKTHTIPYTLVNEKLKETLLSGYKISCRVCKNQNLDRIISLGFVPLANNLASSKNSSVEAYPLEMNFCKNCLNGQLSYTVNQNKLFDKYLYLSSTSQAFKHHFEIAAKKYIQKLKLNTNSKILDIGSNDGIALEPFKKFGILNVLGIEPANNICKIANKRGIKTLNFYFDETILKKIKVKFDLILASNVFAHTDKLDQMIINMRKMIKKNGTIIIEIQYLVNTLKDYSFDNIYHEHVNYWTLNSLVIFFKKNHLNLYDAEKLNTHGGSLRVYISKNQNKIKTNSFNQILKSEKKIFFRDKIQYNFSQIIENKKKTTIINLAKLKKKFTNIYCYGAPAKSTTLINFFNISKYIKYAIDDNSLKHKKFIPGTNIKILNKKNLKINYNHDCIIVFAWNYYDEIKNKNKDLCKNFYNINSLGISNFKII
jgi:nucleoside-diphosphate-sugar epimerase/SAM-dependent methyltransferase